METFCFFRLRFPRACASAYDSDFEFLLGHKRFYYSVYDYDSDSVASENQPLSTTGSQFGSSPRTDGTEKPLFLHYKSVGIRGVSRSVPLPCNKRQPEIRLVTRAFGDAVRFKTHSTKAKALD